MLKLCTRISLTVCALTLSVSAPAFAAHWGSPVSFGSGQLSYPIGVAADQTTGNVYVGNFLFVGNDKFDSSHSLLTPPSPFGLGSGLYSGIAVNPTSGDVYVVDAGSQEIQTYNPVTGALLSSFSVSGSANLEGLTVVQIATDAAGNVYLPNAPSNEVQVFDSTGATPVGVATPITGTGENALSAPTGVAIGPTGDVWIADTGNNRIEEFEPSGAFVKQIASPGVRAVAVDNVGDVFASVYDSSGAHILEYDPSGAQIDDFGHGTLGALEFETPDAISIDETNEVVYVADGGGSVVWAFQRSPEVITNQASEVQQTTATLNGHVDPAGSGEITSCEFEYGATTSYGQVAPCVPSTPYSGARDVSAELTGLESKNTYHYRLDAANAHGIKENGADRTVTTLGSPAIDSESSSDAITTSANVNAQINPFGYDTTCQIQYVDDASFQASGYTSAITLPCSPPNLGHGIGDQSASAKLTGLQIATVYHYHFIVTNQAGTATGADQVFATFGIKSFSLDVVDQNIKPYTQAGGHPYEMITSFSLNTTNVPGGRPEPTDANPRNVRTELPPGLIGNPEAIRKCAPYNVAHANCSGDTQVGVLTVYTVGSLRTEVTESPIYNLVPPAGVAAQFGARFNGFVTAHIDAKVRTGGDYGVTADALYISAAEGLSAATVTLWGVPADESHDFDRYCPKHGTVKEERPCSIEAPLVPFLSNPTSCLGTLTSVLALDSWQEPDVFARSSAEMPGITGCEKLDFSPTVAIQPESTSSDSSSGLQVKLHVPQNENPTGLAEANLKDARVTLPQGVTINPSTAKGRRVCTPAQIGMTTPEPANCPEASKVGKVEIDSPLIDHPLLGSVYIASQNDNPFGSLFAVYIAVNDPETGVVVKLAGKVSPDPVTGQLTTTFNENPQLPFEDLKLTLFGGAQAALATPTICGTYNSEAALTPWSAPASGPSVTLASPFQITSGPRGASCVTPGFAPSFTAGTVSNHAGGFSSLTTTLSRNDGEQRFGGVSVQLPPGLAGILAGIPLCGEANANAGTCPIASKIGHVTVTAGVGSDPVVLPEPGKPEDPVYLTGPYTGGPFGLSIVVPAEAGPFNLNENGKPVIVRAKIQVDPFTAQVSVISDPLPSILQGVPTDVRAINVMIDRKHFTYNPTNCKTLAVNGTITSIQGASANVTSRFQAADCRALAYKPGFSVSASPPFSRTKGASLNFKITPPKGQANTSKVRLVFPKALPTRLSTLKLACLARVFEANPSNCSPDSIVGSATAHTPVLAKPLTGPIYLVSHGSAAFPDAEIVLQGEGIKIIMDGKTNIQKGITSSTFGAVPDAPFTKFEAHLPAGPHSAFTAVIKGKRNGSLCGTNLNIGNIFVGQNGLQIKRNTKITITNCPKKKKHKKK